MVLSLRVKIIILNILHVSESKRHEPMLKIAFMLLTTIVVTVFVGPWSANHTSSMKSPDNFRMMMRILTIFYFKEASTVLCSVVKHAGSG